MVEKWEFLLVGDKADQTMRKRMVGFVTTYNARIQG
jgi:hypothetical protein